MFSTLSMKKISTLFALVIAFTFTRAQYTTIYENSFRDWAPGQGWVLIDNDNIPQSICQLNKSDLDGVFNPVTEVQDNMLGFCDTTRMFLHTPYGHAGSCDKVMITPPITLTGSNVNVIFYSAHLAGSTFNAYVLSNPNDTTLAGLTNNVLACSNDGFNVINLNQWANTTIRIAFRLTGVNTYGYIDNIKVLDKTANAVIPDSCFRAYLRQLLPTCFVGYNLNFLDPLVLNTTVMIDTASCIQSLEGLQYFPFLHYMNFSNNQITYIPVDRFYYCDSISLNNNLLTVAPPVPLATMLYEENNLLHTIPDFLPRDVMQLQFRNNSLYDCLRPCNRFVYANFRGNIGVNIGGATYYYMTTDSPYIQQNMPQFCKHDYGTIKGFVYYDVNQNGIYDGGDFLVPNHRIGFTQGDYIWTYDVGQYAANIDSGNINLTVIDLPQYFVCANPLNGVLHQDQTLTHNFRLTASSSIDDLAVHIASNNRVGQGGHLGLNVQVVNNGTGINSGTVKLYLAPGYGTIHTYPNATINNDTLTWQVTLNPFESKSLYTDIIANYPQADTVGFTAIVSSPNDANPGNNIDSCKVIIAGHAHDPNFKSVNTPQVDPGFSGYLNYCIDFENTGTANATRVLVRDFLSHKFDFNTFEFLGSSHPCTLNWGHDSVPQFVFYPITLTPRSVDSVHSSGHVFFRVKPLQPLQAGDFIPNTASIIFDNEAPVNTDVCLVWAGDLHANFNSSNTTECGSYAKVSFTDVSPANVDNTRRWLFPGGTPDTSIATSPSVRYDTTGDYTVTLIENGNDYTDTVTKIIHVTVASTPARTITASGPVHFCLGDSVTFTAPAGPGYTYRWYSGDSTQSVTMKTGYYNNVTISDAIGCTISSSVFIIASAPAPVITNNNDCQNTTAHLTVTPAFAHYNWNTGDTTNPVNVNSYRSVIVTVTDSLGCVGRDTFDFVYRANPQPVILGDSLVCSGNTVHLYLGQTYQSYTWSNNTTYPYLNISSGGNYSVTVKDAFGCVGADTIIHSTKAAPSGAAHAGGTICKGQSANISYTASQCTYLWFNGDTTSSTRVYGELGNGPYYVTVTGANGCTSVAGMFINATTKFNLQATALDTAFLCPGANINLHANYNTGLQTAQAGGANQTAVIGTGNVTEGGTSTQQPGLFSNNKKGNRAELLYTATELEAALGGPKLITSIAFKIATLNSHAAIQNFSIKMAPTTEPSAYWFLHHSQLVEVYSAASFTPDTGWNTFNLTTPVYWDGTNNLIVDFCSYNPGTQGNLVNKAVCSNVTGFYPYTVWWDSTNLCGMDGATGTYSYRPNIKLGYCTPQSAPNEIASPNIQWTWQGGPATITTPTARNTSATADSLVMFIVTVSDTFGCSEKDSIVLPGTRFTPVNITGNLAPVCSGDSTQLCATSGLIAYSWNTGATTNCTYATLPGTYTVLVTETDICTTSKSVNVQSSNITPVATANNNVASTSTYGLNYQWYMNDTLIAGATGTSYTALQTGDYKVQVTDTFGCQSFSNSVHISVIFLQTTGMGADKLQMRLYPNPFTDVFTLEVEGDNTNSSNVVITNLLGQQVYNYKPDANASKYTQQFNLSNMADGIYFVTLRSGTQQLVKRLVKGNKQ